MFPRSQARQTWTCFPATVACHRRCALVVSAQQMSQRPCSTDGRGSVVMCLVCGWERPCVCDVRHIVEPPAADRFGRSGEKKSRDQVLQDRATLVIVLGLGAVWVALVWLGWFLFWGS